jgi:mevalonate kinase
MTAEKYYSNGKLLLTGEYFILNGALSLALPLRMGQTMKIRYLNDTLGVLYWNTYVQEELWFQASFKVVDFELISTTDPRKAEYIRNILVNAAKFNAELVCGRQSKIIETYLDFLPEWGFGSSSSLISNLAYWIKADPFDLFWSISEGSGYDIACARANGPILYQLNDRKPLETPIDYFPSFYQFLHFVYLGEKAYSSESIKQNKEYIKLHQIKSSEISAITQNLLKAVSLQEFEVLITQHEEIVSDMLHKPTTKSRLFSDFPGTVKSLGAWGGDFILVASKEKDTYVRQYFNAKGLNQIFAYKEIVL